MLLERDRELERIGRCLSRAQEGRGSALVVEGRPGIGKTALLAAARSAAKSEALTASERRIAELAAEGLTNAQIAQTLFVTARTVEGHLTHVFLKLHVKARTELPAALAAPTQAVLA
jgi:DNA-binding CsgD family transcriptional regulator